MVVYTHKHNYGLFGVETTYGTPVVPAKDFGLMQSVTPSLKNNNTQVYSTGSRLPQQIVSGMLDVNLDMEFLYQHGRIFMLAFGTTPTHAQTTSDYTHTIVDTTAALPVASNITRFTYEEGFDDSSDVAARYTSCQIGSLTVSLDVNGRLTCRASCSAQTIADPASVQASVISSLPVHPHFFATLSAGVAGSEVALVMVQSCEITFETQLTPVPGLGTRLKQDEVAGEASIRYRYTLAFQTRGEYNRFVSGVIGTAAPATGTVAPTGLKFNSNNGVTLGSGRRELNIELRDCYGEDFSNPVQIGGFIITEFTGYARQLYKLTTVDNIAGASF